MADKAPKKGDPVLWYGFDLIILDIEDRGNGVQVAIVDDADNRVIRQEARAALQALRKEEAAEVKKRLAELDEIEHGDRKAVALEVKRDLDIPARVDALTEKASAAVVHAKLRLDLLDWWDERGVWVSDGRILTDAQKATFKRITGHNPKPKAQREALVIIEKLAEMES